MGCCSCSIKPLSSLRLETKKPVGREKLQNKNQHETLWVLQNLSRTDLKKTFFERSLEVSGVPHHSPKQTGVADAMCMHNILNASLCLLHIYSATVLAEKNLTIQYNKY